MEWPSPERQDSSGVVLADDGRQGDPGSTEVPQHNPVLLEHLLLLRLRGTMGPVRSRLPDGVLGERQQRELGVVPQVEPPLCQPLFELDREDGM
jgi:hypothetical protein